MLESKLACGPMSKEVIEAVFRYSHRYDKELMLICSRNQIDRCNGYVFTTQKYMDYVAEMEHKYPQSNVIICRDHCGPGFGSEDDTLRSVEDTIRCDLECGFDLIHIDLCHADSLIFEYSMSNAEKLHHTIELMKFAKNIRSDVMFEIGTDENIGIPENSVDKIISNIKACRQVASPVFYVVQTGSLVRETHNTENFDIDVIKRIKDPLYGYGIKLKEHNTDYLTTKQIARRKNVIDAVNIAPQLGVVQTSHVLSKALLYGIDTQPFIHEVINGNKWKKWSDNPNDHYLCALIAGHYHFNEPEYKYLIDQLASRLDIRESIIQEITKVIEHYLFALE